MPAAHQISASDLKKMPSRLEALKKRVARFKGHGEEMMEKFVRTVEVSGMAMGMGVLAGRTGGIEVVGVPVELGIGLGLNLLGYFGAAGKHSEHLNNLGDGALAAYLTNVGQGIGKSMKAKLGSGTKTSGDLPAGGKKRILTDEELQRAVHGE